LLLFHKGRFYEQKATEKAQHLEKDAGPFFLVKVLKPQLLRFPN
jgi:hypothetical protein